MGNIVSWELKALVGFGFITLWENRERDWIAGEVMSGDG